MTDQVNGNRKAGSFLSGQPQWFSFATIAPLAQTNVDTPVVDLPGYQTYATLGIWTNVTVTNGAGTAVTYSTLNTYLDAFYKQRNMDTLVNTFSGRGNPVQIGLKILPSSINGATINANTSVYFAQAGYYNNNASVSSVFGSAYTTGSVITIVNISTEKNNEWETYGNSNYSTSVTADNTNTNGYLILGNNTLYGGLDGLGCFDTQSAQVLSGSSNSSAAATNSQYATTNTVAPYVNTWNTSSATLTNTMVAMSTMLAGTSLV
jgi:hypothetical protein